MKSALLFVCAAAFALPTAFAQNDSATQVAVQKALSASFFKDVHASVQNGVVTLTGSVDLYFNKVNADQRVSHVPGVSAVRDETQVVGPTIPDRKLRAKIERAIAHSAFEYYGFLPNAYQTISVQVQNGAVTLDGHVYGPIFASEVVVAVASTKGVKDLIDKLQVGPRAPLITEWPSVAAPNMGTGISSKSGW